MPKAQQIIASEVKQQCRRSYNQNHIQASAAKQQNAEGAVTKPKITKLNLTPKREQQSNKAPKIQPHCERSKATVPKALQTKKKKRHRRFSVKTTSEEKDFQAVLFER